MQVVILLGAPGSGKGTIAARMAGNGIAHVSSGDLLRGAIKSGTPAGCEAKAFMDKGELVPDALIARMIEDYMTTEKSVNTLLLDGFPRTVPQAEMLKEIIAKQGATLKCALLLDVSDDVVIARISGRRVCPKCSAGYHVVTLAPKVAGICDACGAALVTRSDDAPETVQHRLSVYAEQTFPLIAYYRESGALRTIDGSSDDLDTKVKMALKVIE